jgi:hypothetical protein
MFAVSVLVLFFEVFLIRWVSTEVNIFAYLQNAVLVLCLFALGAGCLKPTRTIPIYKTFVILGFLLIAGSLSFSDISLNSISICLSVLHDFVVWSQWENPTVRFQLILSSVGLLTTVALSIFIFDMVAPLGQLLGGAFKNDQKPLKLYSANIAGSLVGILLFAALGAASAHPLSWVVVLVLISLPFVLEDRASRTKNLLSCGFAIAGGLLGVVLDDSIETRWSPYQKLSLMTVGPSSEHVVQVNNSGYQQIQDNSNGTEGLFSNYDLPSRFKSSAKKVLVVGAGTGNDIAGALRGTQGDVIAVEIDPVIVDFGRRFHPERPYQNPRVTVVNTDARAFFEQSKEKFDLIVFGLLDSHTTTSLTNARLDHFVYTNESISAARKLLNEGGVFALIFEPQRSFIVERLAKTLLGAFGTVPKVIKIKPNKASWGGSLFLTGDEASIEQTLASDPELSQFISSNSVQSDWMASQVETTSDDWPYLYLDSRRIPTLFLLLGVVFVVVWLYAKKTYGLYSLYERGNFGSTLHFLGLGTAFTLLEVFGINRAAILFGNTWYTNCAVISGVLGMILVANFVVLRFPTIPKGVGYIGLFAALVAVWLTPFEALMSYSLAIKVVAVMLVCGLPMLFSGIVFARSFDASVDQPRALSANLFGALVGGVLQSVSFVVGIKMLLMFVGVFYAVAWIADLLRHDDADPLPA